MNNRREPTLANIFEELQQLRYDLRASGKALLTVPETADFLGLAPKTIRNQLSTGTFPVQATRLGGRVLFRRSDLERYVAGLGQ